MQTLAIGQEPSTIFVAGLPGIYAAVLEPVDGEALVISSRRGIVLASGASAGTILYLIAGEELSAFSPSMAIVDWAISRIG